MTTRFALRLPNHQGRLVALAVSYHLARPGAEIDHETLTEYQHGLAEVMPEIEAQLEAGTVALDLNPLQTVLLSAAFSSVISELKMYSTLDTMAGGSSRPRSTAHGFDDRLRTLFPEVAGDPSYASRLAEDMTMLRRQLPSGRARQIMEEERQASLAAAKPRRRPWQLWRRR